MRTVREVTVKHDYFLGDLHCLILLTSKALFFSALYVTPLQVVTFYNFSPPLKKDIILTAFRIINALRLINICQWGSFYKSSS